MTKIEELKTEVEKLLLLLNDPHPGLSTWREFVNERIEAIKQFSGEPRNRSDSINYPPTPGF